MWALKFYNMNNITRKRTNGRSLMPLKCRCKVGELWYASKSGEACKPAHLDPQRAVGKLLFLCSCQLALEAKHGSVECAPDISMQVKIDARVLLSVYVSIGLKPVRWCM